MLPWGKIDYSTGVFTLYYSDKATIGGFEKDEYMVFGVRREDRDYRNPGVAPKIEKVVIDKSMANYHPDGTDIFDSFQNLSNLKSIEGLEYLDVSEVTSLNRFFDGCSSLTTLDLSSFDTRNLEKMDDMFNGCSNLTTILVSDKFVTDKIRNPDRTVFSGCTSLVGDIPFDADCTDCTYAKTKGGYFTYIIRPWATFADGTLTFRYGTKKSLATNEYRLHLIETTPDWLAKASSIKHVVFDNSFANARPTNCYNWFLDCKNLETVEGLEYFNASEVETMEQMFSECSSLTSLDLTRLDVSNVTNMFRMFYDCRALTTLDLTGFNTAKVKNARGMFADCSNLTTIYADELFALPDDANTSGMFTGCTSLKGDIVYDPAVTDKTYATVDGGYLSQKSLIRPWAKYADGTLTFYYSSKKKLAADEHFIYDNNSTPGWNAKAGSIKKVVFDESFASIKPTSCYQWFKDASQLTTFEGLKYFNTSELTNMYMMFFGCSSLAALDFSELPLTQKVTNMSWMFYGCSSLKSLNLSKLRRSFPRVTNFERMFMGCSSLESLNLATYATTNATDMTGMFYGCSSLTSLDLSSFNTEKVDGMTNMFNGCTSLKTLDLSNFDTYNCRYFSKMFYECSSLVTIYATEMFRFNTDRRPESRQMFENCTNLKGSTLFNRYVTDKTYAKVDNGYFTDKQYTRPWVKYTEGALTFTYGYKKTFDANAGEYAFYDENGNDGAWRELMPQVKSADFSFTFAFFTPQSCNTWFRGASQLAGISNFPGNVDMSKITDLSRMFEGCSSLTYVTLYGLNMTNVTDMSGLFKGCTSLGDVSLNDNTQNVTNMAEMFKDCSSAILLDLDNINTASVTDMHDMFAGCTSLRTITASNKLVTTNVENSTDMFAGCTKLKGEIAFDPSAVDKTYAKFDGGYFSLPSDIHAWVAYSDADKSLTFQYGYKKALGKNEYWLNDKTTEPGWNEHRDNTKKVVFDPSFDDVWPTSCYQWFCDNPYISTIEGIEYLHTTEVSTMREMFKGCIRLTSLDVSHFDTRYVKNMYDMFYYCTNLKSLDVSNFNTSNVTDMGNMFSYCSKLESIYLGENFAMVTDAGKWNFNGLPTNATICAPLSKYTELKARTDFANVNLRPYFSINAKSPFGTLCVPFGGTLAEGSHSGFDKLYRVKDADANEGTITFEETTTIEPGVAYVYRRDLPEDAAKSIITFTVDDNVASVSEPQNDGSLMKGTFERIVAPEGSYLLQSDGNFHPVPAGNTTIGVGANRAYLDLSTIEASGAKTYRMVFEEKETSSMKGISDEADEQPKVYFDLMGRRTAAPQKGKVYIVNGKKVVL